MLIFIVIVNVVVIVIVSGIVIVIVIVGAMFGSVYAVVVVINMAIVVAEVLASGYTSQGLSMYHNDGKNVTISTIIIYFMINIYVIIVISFISLQ